MERVWAPWRIEYLRQMGSEDEGCVLCAARDSSDDRARHVLWRGAYSFVILNKYPYTSGHLMLVPNAHGGAFADVASEALAEMMRMAQVSVEILMRVLRADGANVGLNVGRAAGAGLADHIHLHVVPRWNGDTNFMPVFGDIRVIPEALDATWEHLRPHFDGAALKG